MAKEEVPIRFRNKDPLVVGNQVFISSNVWDLTDMELERARVELGETEEKKLRFLKELKDRLSKEGDFRLDDPFLLRFLRVRKYDLEKAYLSVKNYYNVRKKHPDFYGNPSHFSSSKSHDVCTLLPYTDEGGRVLSWVEVGCWDPRATSVEEAMQLMNGFWNLCITNPKVQVNGIIGIWDCKELDTRQVARLLKSTSQLLSITLFLTFSMPWRINKVVVFNSGRLTRFAYSIVRPLLSKKLSERVFLLGSDMKELHEHVNPAILPKKLGGKLEDDFCRKTNFLLDNIPYLEYERSFTGAWEGK